MLTAKVFENGRSQAIRLPKECRVKDKEVSINKIGDILIVTPIGSKWGPFLESLNNFSEDFMQERPEQPQLEERDLL